MCKEQWLHDTLRPNRLKCTSGGAFALNATFGNYFPEPVSKQPPFRVQLCDVAPHLPSGEDNMEKTKK